MVFLELSNEMNWCGVHFKSNLEMKEKYLMQDKTYIFR